MAETILTAKSTIEGSRFYKGIACQTRILAWQKSGENPTFFKGMKFHGVVADDSICLCDLCHHSNSQSLYREFTHTAQYNTTLLFKRPHEQLHTKPTVLWTSTYSRNQHQGLKFSRELSRAYDPKGVSLHITATFKCNKANFVLAGLSIDAILLM